MGKMYVEFADAQYDVSMNLDGTGLDFKRAIADVTHVPPERQKVLIKGGLLKDDTPLGKVGARAGQQFMVLGAVGELPKAPEKPVQFLEDLPEDELNKAKDLRVGLVNLGNTCYLNATLQLLRAIPQLEDALNAFPGRIGSNQGDASFTAALRDLFQDMRKTTEPVPPLVLLSTLRKIAPQFAEMSSTSGGFAQQDAEEAWLQIIQALASTRVATTPSEPLVAQYLTGHMSIERRCKEAPNETPAQLDEPFQILQCTISSQTNDMESGILDSFSQKLEKHSEQLQRTAVYDETRRITRLSEYLFVHFVRFYWRRDINKKTKIMRKVKFPKELDASSLVTPELARRLSPVSAKIRAVEKERADRAKIRARAKERHLELGAVEGGALTDEQEREQRSKEAADIQATIDPDLSSDHGCNVSGLYDLVGIVTHKGAAADAGHYMSWVRKSAVDPPSDSLDAPSQDWYKFDDDKVTIVPPEKIEMLYGGGEDSVAYILLYRAKSLS